MKRHPVCHYNICYNDGVIMENGLADEAEQLTFGDQAKRLRPAQPVLAGRLRCHRAVTNMK